MEVLFVLAMFAVGLLLLVVGSDLFVDSSVAIAHRFHIPELVIGATLVSIGTTLPEVLVSSTAAAGGMTDMAMGNAVGSVICNTALIAGFVQAVRPSEIDRRSFSKATAQFFVFAAVFVLFGLFHHSLSRVNGLILLLLFAFYNFFTFHGARGAVTDSEGVEGGKRSSLPVQVVLLVIEALALFFGARLLVSSGAQIAQWMHVPQRVISLTLIALGTSLPELVTAVSALIKKHAAISLGNIIGANILNLLLVGGFSSVIAPLPVPPAVLCSDIPVMLFAMAVLTVPGVIFGKLRRWQGFLLLALYAGYLMYLF